ncbi:uncharacterized protein HD556DRAFT_1308446 [Suillus plorans]|uniref:Uncharacterized protein n=1 Tax=Suillus plorans TaxID=116603 RepID=A0A9P7AQF8_9AGAM|nr:uncharacterized protein HD556DRAFT_1308446 [Suillus plorans]KAG1794003.1 hypothetical protein HD556DRAFT_1308446 [Suillus plorans]
MLYDSIQARGRLACHVFRKMFMACAQRLTAFGVRSERANKKEKASDSHQAIHVMIEWTREFGPNVEGYCTRPRQMGFVFGWSDTGKAGVESETVTLQSLDDESETVADMGSGKGARV